MQTVPVHECARGGQEGTRPMALQGAQRLPGVAWRRDGGPRPSRVTQMLPEAEHTQTEVEDVLSPTLTRLCSNREAGPREKTVFGV